jgi:N4-gp56 family major capsid protein
MPILRFEQFAVKKTELGVQPGLTINFMRYNNLGDASQLVEGVRMETNALTSSQFSITVAEHGYAVAVSELLLNASFDDVMASASRLLGRNMALYLDESARNTLLTRLLGHLRLHKLRPHRHVQSFAVRQGHRRRTTRDELTGNVLLHRVRCPSRTPSRPSRRRTSRAWARPTCPSSTRTSRARCVTTRSSSRSRSTPPPATSCSVRSVV